MTKDGRTTGLYARRYLFFISGPQEHERHFRTLLTKLETCELRVNPEKTEAFRKSKFLGHVLSEEGITPNTDKANRRILVTKMP